MSFSPSFDDASCPATQHELRPRVDASGSLGHFLLGDLARQPPGQHFLVVCWWLASQLIETVRPRLSTSDVAVRGQLASYTGSRARYPAEPPDLAAAATLYRIIDHLSARDDFTLRTYVTRRTLNRRRPLARPSRAGECRQRGNADHLDRTPSIGGRTGSLQGSRIVLRMAEPLKKTALDRALEAAERRGVRVTVLPARPGSGTIYFRPGLSSHLLAESRPGVKSKANPASSPRARE